MSILCKLGLHKWGDTHIHYISGSNVADKKRQCKRCGKIEKWVEPVD